MRFAALEVCVDLGVLMISDEGRGEDFSYPSIEAGCCILLFASG